MNKTEAIADIDIGLEKIAAEADILEPIIHAARLFNQVLLAETLGRIENSLRMAVTRIENAAGYLDEFTNE